MKLKAKTNNERKLILNWDLINVYLQGFKPDTWFDITIRRKKRKDSDAQRAYYFGYIMPQILEGVGYEPQEYKEVGEQLHFNFKCVYFNIEPDKYGVYKNVPHVFDKGKSKLDVSEKNKFIDFVKRYVAKDVYVED